jgi:pimeloyl-ACP methyl ester carboxylesterase
MLGAVMMMVAVLAVLPVAATAATYATARRRGETGTEPLRVAERIRGVLAETGAALAVVAALPLRLRPARPRTVARGVVLLIPELYCSSAGFHSFARRLADAGWTVLAAAEHPTSRGAEAVAAGLDARIELVPADVDVVVLGHGFGGIFATRYAATRPRVRRVVTLGTPHQGSQALPYRWLAASTDPAPEAGSAADVTAIYSDFDAWLVPVDDAYCPGGFNIAVGGVGHCAMLRSRRVADLVVENLARPPATRSPTN